MQYKAEGVPLVIFAGVEYGNGSSRDWAAKGTNLLGVKAVIAQSFERIHRSNLVGMGIIPFVFEEGTTWATLGLKGDELVDHRGSREHQAAREEDRQGSPMATARCGTFRSSVARRYARRGDLPQQWRHPADGAARPRSLIFNGLHDNGRRKAISGGFSVHASLETAAHGEVLPSCRLRRRLTRS
jgi:hypothetical protein